MRQISKTCPFGQCFLKSCIQQQKQVRLLGAIIAPFLFFPPHPLCRAKENRSLDKNPGSGYNEHRKGADQQTASSLPNYVRKIDRSDWELRRSFFLAFIIAVRHSPCNLERRIDCSPKKGEQDRNFFKRHGQIPPFRP